MGGQSCVAWSCPVPVPAPTLQQSPARRNQHLGPPDTGHKAGKAASLSIWLIAISFLELAAVQVWHIACDVPRRVCDRGADASTAMDGCGQERASVLIAVPLAAPRVLCHKQLHRALGREQRCNVPRQDHARALSISHHEFQESTPASSAPFEHHGPAHAQCGRGEEQGRTDLGSAGQAAPVAPELLGLPRTRGSEFFPLTTHPLIYPLVSTRSYLYMQINARQWPAALRKIPS